MVRPALAAAVTLALVTWTHTLTAHTGWPRVAVRDPFARVALITALDEASRWLDKPDCRKVFTEFTDGSGRPLADRLAMLETDPQGYLSMIVFVDGSLHQRCALDTLAFTEPESRVVHVCAERIKQAWIQNRNFTVAALIHEALHTLGLGENPPSSKEITARVIAHCRA